MSNQSNSDHEQFTMDRQMMELFKRQTEQNTELLRNNNQLVAKIEEKNNITQEQNTELLGHNKELLQYNKELSVKLEEKNNLIQKKVSEIGEKELYNIFIINALLFCFFMYLWFFQKRPF